MTVRASCLAATLALLAAGGPALTDAALAQGQSPTWNEQVLSAINAERARLGLGELSWSTQLHEVADGHSRRMAAERKVTHEGFQARFDGIASDLCVENVAGGTLQPQVLLRAWSRATGHRRNLLEPRVRRAGIAAVGAYVTFFACE